ncbi:MAG: substrate-binding domain-containing protein [Clostridia bacterium]
MKRKMKIVATILCVAVIGAMAVGLTACNGGEKNILVISREDGSGTRDAFDGLVKNADNASLKKDANGNDYTSSPLVKSAEILSKTGDVITKVSSTKTAIGYISLGSLNDTVKAVSINGIVASAKTVLDGAYALKRPFVIVTSNSVAMTAATADFLKYLSSSEAQKIVTAEKYVEQASKTAYIAPTTALSDTIVIKGSTSIDKLMDGLIANYRSLGGAKVSDIVFEKDAQGSSYGLSAAKGDTTGNVIGMSSSAIKSADATSLNQITIALDAVAVIVNNNNSLTNITIAQLYDIYTGAITKYSQLSSATNEG